MSATGTITASLAFGEFLRLAGSVVKFRKEVLRVWSGVDPNTGKPLDFSRSFLESLARNTNEYIALGNDVYAPDGHTEKALANCGRWTRFYVEGDKLYGDFEPADSTIAAAIGTRIRGVSIFAKGPVLASAGVVLSSAILHVCLTPCPVLPGQENFIRLAIASKETPMPEIPATSTTPAAPTTTKLAADPAALAPTAMKPAEFLTKAEGLLGLKDASWDDIFDALRAALMDEAGEDESASMGMAPAIMARLARREKAIEAKLSAKFSTDLAALHATAKAGRESHARDLIELARKRSTESGTLFEKESQELALSLLSSESPEMQKAGRAVLSAQDKLAEGALMLARSGRTAATPEAEQRAKATVAASDAAVEFITGAPLKTRTLSG